MDNVIQFPNSNKRIEAKTIEEFDEDIIDHTISVKMFHVNDTLNITIPMLFNNIELAGFSPTEEEIDSNYFVKDGLLIVESIRSLLFKHYKMYHPMQEIANSVFEKLDEDNYDITSKLELTFDKTLLENAK